MDRRAAGLDLNILAYVIGVPTEALIHFVLSITGQAVSGSVPEGSPRPARGEEPAPDPIGQGSRRRQLVLDLDGYEGPIDLLLSLAREQKVDLAKISILAWPTSISPSSIGSGNGVWRSPPITWSWRHGSPT